MKTNKIVRFNESSSNREKIDEFKDNAAEIEDYFGKRLEIGHGPNGSVLVSIETSTETSVDDIIFAFNFIKKFQKRNIIKYLNMNIYDMKRVNPMRTFINIYVELI